MNSGHLVLETAWSRKSDCMTQCKVSRKIQIIHHSTDGSHDCWSPSVLNLCTPGHSVAAAGMCVQHSQNYSLDLCDINSRLTQARITIWQYKSIKLLQDNINTVHTGITMQKYYFSHTSYLLTQKYHCPLQILYNQKTHSYLAECTILHNHLLTHCGPVFFPLYLSQIINSK
jgi:hypothetical protein